jgi:hypothetical protein
MGAEIHRENFTAADYALFKERLRGGLRAFSTMLERPDFGRGERSIGTELEFFLVDGLGHVMPVGAQLVAAANRSSVTHEMGAFDVELSTRPARLLGSPFTAQRENLQAEIARLKRLAATFGARAVPIGVLPTLRRSDFDASAITDMPRYRALAAGMKRLRQAPFKICIDGDDPLRLTTDEVAMEAANAAFHVHLRVAPDEFADFFNAVMMLSGPVLAAAGNSPTFLGHRLWQETRVALFKQAGDDRSPETMSMVRLPSRIGFGNGWVRKGALELFTESVALHEPLLAECGDEDPEQAVREHGLAQLWELRLHHGTVWKWNRPVYDPVGGGHLRIEVRFLPAGPSVDDMLANAAFMIGSTLALAPRAGDLLPSFPHSLAERNFYRCAQFGLDAMVAWPAEPGATPEILTARDLLLKLLPGAAEGLRGAGVDPLEIEYYLGIFEARVCSGRTGATWQRSTFDLLNGRSQRREWALSEMLEQYIQNFESGAPVSMWEAQVPSVSSQVPLY